MSASTAGQTEVMAYDPVLAERLRQALADVEHREVAMFGGLSFMVDDKLALSASNQGDLLLRCDPGDVDELVAEPHVRWAEMRNRRMSKGWLRVGPGRYDADEELARWVEIAVEYATR